MEALSIQGLKKSFESTKVLEDVNLTVPENSIFGFIGKNGAGKTTTMKLILGLLKPDAGEIRIFGEKVAYGETKTNRFTGYLPDVPEYYNYMTAREYLKLCGEITGLSKDTIKERSHNLLELVGLANNKKRIGGYSRGMKQRLGIAQALLGNPKLLICDEPTSALDPLGRKEILDILSRLKGKTTVIFSTHVLTDVERICDRIGILNNGKIVASGELESMKQKYAKDSILMEFSKDDEEKVLAALKPIDIEPINTQMMEPSLEDVFLEVTR